MDEVCVQATHLEARGKQNIDEKSDSEGKGKGKFYERGKRNSYVKREKEKLTCKHCLKNGYDEYHCWQLQPELKPNKLKAKEKGKIVAIVEHDLGSDSGDEKNITSMGLKGENIANTISSNCSNVTQDEDTRI